MYLSQIWQSICLNFKKVFVPNSKKYLSPLFDNVVAAESVLPVPPLAPHIDPTVTQPLLRLDVQSRWNIWDSKYSVSDVQSMSNIWDWIFKTFKISYIGCLMQAKYLILNVQYIWNSYIGCSKQAKQLRFKILFIRCSKYVKHLRLNIQNIQYIQHQRFKADQSSDIECSIHLKFLYRIFKAGETSEVQSILYQMFKECQTSEIDYSKH